MMEQLLLRHSSPLVLASSVSERSTTTTIPRSNLQQQQRQRSNSNASSPSPLRLNRPRSNPRNRTPNRIQEEEHQQQAVDDVVVERRVLERQQIISIEQQAAEERMEGRRITIRPMAGAAVGTSMAGTRVRRVQYACYSLRQGAIHSLHAQNNIDTRPCCLPKSLLFSFFRFAKQLEVVHLEQQLRHPPLGAANRDPRTEKSGDGTMIILSTWQRKSTRMATACPQPRHCYWDPPTCPRSIDPFWIQRSIKAKPWPNFGTTTCPVSDSSFSMENCPTNFCRHQRLGIIARNGSIIINEILPHVVLRKRDSIRSKVACGESLSRPVRTRTRRLK